MNLVQYLVNAHLILVSEEENPTRNRLRFRKGRVTIIEDEIIL